MPAAFLGRDVDDDDVGQFLDGDGARHRRADVAGAPYHGHFAVHCSLAPVEDSSLGSRLELTYVNSRRDPTQLS
jgi:hypothetical protein